MSRPTILARIDAAGVQLALDQEERLLLSQPTVARLLDISPRTLRRWRDLQLFPPPDKIVRDAAGREYMLYWKPQTILRWIDQPAPK